MARVNYPLSYVVGFLRLLAERAERYRVVTYDDFDWADDWDHQENFARERANWEANGDPERITVCIHHDVDGMPDRTMAMLREEYRLALRSSVFIFQHRVDREAYERGDGLLLTPARDYQIDDAKLLEYQDHGFPIGYHQNAMDQAEFDFDLAAAIFRADVRRLRARGFACRYFTAHGGLRGPNGLINSSLPLPAALYRDIRWVSNRFCPFYDGRFSDSDGGLQQNGSLHQFVRGMHPGGRYEILLHPQYYPDDCQTLIRDWPIWGHIDEK